MGRSVVIFEDDRVSHLYPLTLTRPAFDLVCGILSLGEKIRMTLWEGAGPRPATGFSVGGPGETRRARTRQRSASLGEPSVWLHARDFVSRACPGSADRRFVTSYGDLWQGSDLVTFVNARLVFGEDLLEKIDFDWAGKYLVDDATAVANVPKDRAEHLAGLLSVTLGDNVFADLPSRPVEAKVVRHPWDIIRYNAEEIASDFRRLGGSRMDSEPGLGVHLVNPAAMRIAEGVGFSPGVVVDAAEGPVSIESGVQVMANAVLCGPLHLGADSVIRAGATIYGGTSMGPMSRVGGEVAETVIQGYSNKQHGGFVGHSYLGEWVNIGAGTNTSDMKNNYSTVRVRVAGTTIDTGELFLGLVMGDHSKSGIGTIFNAGTTVGVCSNVFGAGYPPKAIPSFAWGGVSGFVEHEIGAAIETARRVVGRRGKTLEAPGEAVLRKVYELTADERSAFLRR